MNAALTNEKKVTFVQLLLRFEYQCGHELFAKKPLLCCILFTVNASYLVSQAASTRSSASSIGTENPHSDADKVDNNPQKENGNSTATVRLADKIHCIRTNNITDEYELKEEIGVSLWMSKFGSRTKMRLPM